MMDTVIFRTMSETDYEEAVQLWEMTAGIGLSEADGRERTFRYLLRNPGMSRVAEVEGRLVGAVLCGHDGRRGYLHHLAVDSRYRRRGLGRRLVESCMDRLAEEEIDRCHLFVYPDNELGLEFWHRMGFDPRKDIQLCSRNL